MPRVKKVNSQYTIKKQTSRKAPKRVSITPSKHEHFDENIFWNKVIKGFKKLLSPAFK